MSRIALPTTPMARLPTRTLISHSSISTYQSCPLKYYFKYVLGLAEYRGSRRENRVGQALWFQDVLVDEGRERLAGDLLKRFSRVSRATTNDREAANRFNR